MSCSKPITGADDQAQWLDETLAGARAGPVAPDGGVDRRLDGGRTTRSAGPGRVASLTLLDPVMTFARIPMKTLLISGAMVLPACRHGPPPVLQLDPGGAEVDDSVPEAALIAAGSTDFVLRLADAESFTDDQLRGSTSRCWRLSPDAA